MEYRCIACLANKRGADREGVWLCSCDLIFRMALLGWERTFCLLGSGILVRLDQSVPHSMMS
jgi:hypothetical protein